MFLGGQTPPLRRMILGTHKGCPYAKQLHLADKERISLKLLKSLKLLVRAGSACPECITVRASLVGAQIHQHYDIEITEIIDIWGAVDVFRGCFSVNVSGRADPAPTVDVIGHPQGMPLRETITPCGCFFLLRLVTACNSTLCTSTKGGRL